MIQHISISDLKGGAARAAWRLHNALLLQGVDSRMLVLRKESQCNTVEGLLPLPLDIKLKRFIQRQRLAYRTRGWHTDNNTLHSFGVVDLGLKSRLSGDVIHLHWVCDMMSVETIGALSAPIVWTLHDMWPFCGAEHYVDDTPGARFKTGYLKSNRSLGERGADVNRWVWDRKRHAWAQKNITIIGPSRWIAECAAQSVLFRNCTVKVIPNPLDTDKTWRPIPKQDARIKLGLPITKSLLLTGAMGNVMDERKGLDLLFSALQRLAQGRDKKMELVVFGQASPATHSLDWPVPVHWMGQIDDDQMIATLYSSADLMLVPSRKDNLPQTAVEAQACGTPVVAFDIGGLPDIVEHRHTGWLATPFDVGGLANGIEWVLEKTDEYGLRKASRDRACALFSNEVVASQYIKIYEEVISG